ncbi:Uncharacterised protein [Segatella copri]|nr:Uncharacterised protein [Segatella copri]
MTSMVIRNPNFFIRLLTFIGLLFHISKKSASYRNDSCS